MNLLSFFNRRTSAPVARERLQILLAHERGIVGGKPDLVAQLREEILAVVRRHVMVDQDNVQVKMNRPWATFPTTSARCSSSPTGEASRRARSRGSSTFRSAP